MGLSMNATADFSGHKVLVSGASGFLGSHLCPLLRESGAEVYAISRTENRPVGYSWARCDLGDISAVREILNSVRPDVIFHLTSHGVGGPDLELVLPTLHNDLMPSVNILTVATEVGCQRIVMAASLEEPRPGSDEVTPASPYAAAKWASSAYARMFHRLYRTPVVLVRPYMTYGPGQKTHKLVPHVILSLLKGLTPKLASGLRQVDWIYVDDVTRGLLAAAQAPDVEGCTIDLGSGTLVSIRDLVGQIVDLVGSRIQPLFGALPDRPFEQIRVADTAYSRARLSWSPLIPLRQGLDETVQWYRRTLNE